MESMQENQGSTWTLNITQLHHIFGLRVAHISAKESPAVLVICMALCIYFIYGVFLPSEPQLLRRP